MPMMVILLLTSCLERGDVLKKTSKEGHGKVLSVGVEKMDVSCILPELGVVLFPFPLHPAKRQGGETGPCL
jgi:hypothetical protein